MTRRIPEEPLVTGFVPLSDESLGDGKARLTHENLRRLRAMLARDESEGKADTLRILALSSGEELDAVAVHGASFDVVLRVSARIEAYPWIRCAGKRRIAGKKRRVR